MILSPYRASSTINTLSEAAGREAFATHLRPQLAKLLSAIGLDVVYSRGEGDYLYYQAENGQEQKVLDMLGGFGASLFGHNHPALVRRAMEVLETGRPFASQASARSYAGLLAERLSHLVGQTTGQSYIVTLANSGAEAVEAAIKHAELERVQRMQDIFAALKRTFKSLRLELNKATIRIPDSLYAEAERLLEVPEIADLAEIEADVVGSILLAGRPGTQRRLERLAEAIYARAWQQVIHGETGHGIARAIAKTNLMAHLKPGENPEAVGAIIRQALADELGPSAPIQITTDLADLRQCELIISATNSPTPIIGPEHVGPHPTVICDVSVPTDVQPSLRAQYPQVRVIKGGIMQLPLGQDLSIGGMALPDGQYYACLTEVILLGLAGIREHFSYGLLQAERVRQISQLARQHRFAVIIREA